MASTVVRIAPERDLYFVWSSISEAPAFLGDREALLVHLYERETRHPDQIPNDERPEARIERADQSGTSALWGPSGSPQDHAFADTGTIYQQQGWLPRSRYADLADRILSGGGWNADMRDLLNPFEDGCRCDHAYDAHRPSGCSECPCPLTVS